MAIFSRRTLQAFLDEVGPKLSEPAHGKLVRNLDGRDASASLGFEWELVVLTLLGRVGAVAYEPDLGFPRRPDIVFGTADCRAPRFVADVATVSDTGLEEDNPVSALSSFLQAKAAKLKIPGTFSYDVRGATDDGPEGNRKMRLLLPARSRLREFLERRLTPELTRIARERPPASRIDVEEPPGISFTVTYDASGHFWEGHSPSYVATYSVTRNPIYPLLKKKKKQMKEATGHGADCGKRSNEARWPFGVILCDGDCRLLQVDRPHAPGAINLAQVIFSFFLRNRSISFVLAVKFPEARIRIFSGGFQERRLDAKLYVNPNAHVPLDGNRLVALLNEGLSTMPPPVATVGEALNWLARSPLPHLGLPLNSMSDMGSRLRVPARLVLDLLAGKITADDVTKRLNGQPGEPDWEVNPFVRALRAGQLIRSMSVTRLEHEDDDWVDIEFGPPDPAISKFRERKEGN